MPFSWSGKRSQWSGRPTPPTSEQAPSEARLPRGAKFTVAPSPYGLALRRTTATFPLQARAGAGSSIAPRPHGPPLALARYSPHLSTVRGPTVQARAQRVADPRYVRQTGEPGRAYWPSDLRATRLSAGGFAPLDPKDGASGQRSWSGPRRSLSAAVAHPGLILAGAPVLGGAPVPTGAPVPAGAPGLQRAVAVSAGTCPAAGAGVRPGPRTGCARPTRIEASNYAPDYAASPWRSRRLDRRAPCRLDRRAPYRLDRRAPCRRHPALIAERSPPPGPPIARWPGNPSADAYPCAPADWH